MTTRAVPSAPIGGRAPLPSAMATRIGSEAGRPIDGRRDGHDGARPAHARQRRDGQVGLRALRDPDQVGRRRVRDQLQLAGIGDLDDRRRGRAVDQLAGAAQQADHDAGDRAAHGGALDLSPRPL